MEPSNVLKIDSLDEGWKDKDHVILHACFQLLVDCIEKEDLLEGHLDWDSDEEHKSAKKEITILYKWWKRRLIDEKEESIDPIWTQGQYEEDNRMLIRLIKVRQYLWT